MRRYTRRTNAFSLWSLAYNWARPHMSLGGKSPAMAIGLADHV